MISYISGLRREYHHIKTNREDSQGYEPAMVILHQGKKGKSFIIPIDSIWKYIDPINNQDAQPSDLEAFKDIVNRAMWYRKWAVVVSDRERAKLDLAACAFASALWNENKILPCTGYNLAKMIQMFDLEPSPQTAAQLLLFIQDGLDTLKDIPPLPPEEENIAGEITVWQGGQKIASKELTVKESDLIMEEQEA